MNEDIFDVVNEHDEVVGQAPRSVVHRRGLRHRAVHVLLFNARGELFLQKRSMSKDREPGLWDSSCSGHVDGGEDYDTAVGRELREELGWQPTRPLEKLFRIAASPETDQEFVWVYRGEAEGPFVLHPEEIECGDWFTPEEITHRMKDRPQDFATGFRTVWKRFNATAP